MTTQKISAADVAAWLIEQSLALPFKGGEITVYVSRYTETVPLTPTWMVYTTEISPDGMKRYETADTFEEAVAKVRANIKSPKDKVEALRAQAAEINRKADELAAKLDPAPSVPPAFGTVLARDGNRITFVSAVGDGEHPVIVAATITKEEVTIDGATWEDNGNPVSDELIAEAAIRFSDEATKLFFKP